MTKRWVIGLLLAGALGAGVSRMSGGDPRVSFEHPSKRVIGQTAWVQIAESGLEFIGRVDTGAASTSVHAESIRVKGRNVEFVMVNRDGQRVEMRAPLVKTSYIRNAVGREERVYVDLTVRHDGREKHVRASLNNRSGLSYALLLGRDWLRDDYVVDVTHEPLDAPPAAAPAVSEEARGIASR